MLWLWCIFIWCRATIQEWDSNDRRHLPDVALTYDTVTSSCAAQTTGNRQSTRLPRPGITCTSRETSSVAKECSDADASVPRSAEGLFMKQPQASSQKSDVQSYLDSFKSDISAPPPSCLAEEDWEEGVCFPFQISDIVDFPLSSVAGLWH